MKNCVSENFFLTDPVKGGGTGNHFYFVLGGTTPEVIGGKTYSKTPTWGQISRDIARFCIREGICLSACNEQGSIQQGGVRFPLAPCAKKYIATKVMQALQGKLAV